MVRNSGKSNHLPAAEGLPTHNSARSTTMARRDTSTASTLRVPSEVMIRPTPLLDDAAPSDDLLWYNWWVRRQIEDQPEELFSVIPNAEASTEDHWMSSFIALWRGVWLGVSRSDSSVDDIIVQLDQQGLIKMGNDEKSLCHARNLIFAIIGWQTMLYRPDMGACSPSQLAIVDETDGHRGQAHMCLRQNQTGARKMLHEFLLGFGVLLPCRNFSALASEEDRKALRTLNNISTTSFNAYLLTSVGGLYIRWTDSLACHLEFDSTSNTLYLFRYPSFCFVNQLSHGNQQPNTTLHACAAPPITAIHWATSEAVTDLLREVLLSYRLLFGQTKASRRLFHALNPFEDIPEEGRDSNLLALCGKKTCHLVHGRREREVYILADDFPVLRNRLARLAQHLSNKRPRTWKELWNDKRDSASWFTFWAVTIIGGMGIILAFLQVMLQIVQIGLQTRHP